MKRTYEVTDRADKRAIREFLKREGQFLLPMLELVEQTEVAISGVRQKTRRVTNWKNGAMALRWAAASFVETEKSYRRIIGYDQLWMLRAHLDDHEPVAEMRKAG